MDGMLLEMIQPRVEEDIYKETKGNHINILFTIIPAVKEYLEFL